MKTLDQIEARTAIGNAGATTISAPGSYYLTTNITVNSGDGITISANNVMLNLNGFTVSSSAQPPYGSAILLNGARTNITVLNGFIVGGVTNNGVVYGGSGFSNGVSYITAPYNVRASGVSVSGCLNCGISLVQGSTVIESCTVSTVGNIGIQARTVANSTALNCGYSGVAASTANNCYGNGLSGVGLSANVAGNSQGYSSSGVGLSAASANSCLGFSSSGTGLNASSVAIGCYGMSSSGIGLSANIANSCYGQSTSSTGLCANIAVSCVGIGSPALSVTNKYNMP
jgi:hypothetical protein